MDSASKVSELLTRQFYDWERRGRGWAGWSDPVDLEPPFRPFVGHFLPRQSIVDDGQHETLLSRFSDSFRRLLAIGDERLPPPPIDQSEEPEPEVFTKPSALVEFKTLLPANLDIPREAFEQFLVSLSLCREIGRAHV